MTLRHVRESRNNNNTNNNINNDEIACRLILSNNICGITGNKCNYAVDKKKTEDEYAEVIRSVLSIHEVEKREIRGAIIASVVPPVMYSLEHAIRKYLGINPMVVGPNTKTGINIKLLL